jgi:transcriptional regulator of acetoin/glycerol metabolism
VMEIEIPPLRDRIDDLPALAAHILERFERPKRLHMDALASLAEHTWPGNVRELENVLRAAALLSDGDTVPPEVVRRALCGRRRARERGSRRLAPRAAAIMDRVTQGWWSAPSLASALGISTRTVNRELAALMDQGLVERYGQARASRYRAVGDARRDSSGS